LNNKRSIEQKVKRGEFELALTDLESLPASVWRDTTKLKCLRRLKLVGKASRLAESLHTQMVDNVLSYDGQRPSDSEKTHILRHISLALSEGGQHQAALAIIERLIEESPKLAALYREHSYILNNAGHTDTAEASLKEALLSDPSHVQSHAQLARLYCLTGRVDLGCIAYSRALALEPDNSLLLSKLSFWSNYTDASSQRDQYQLSRIWQKSNHFPSAIYLGERLEQKSQLKIAFLGRQLASSSVLPCLNALLRNLKREADVNLHLKASVTITNTSQLSDKALSKQIAADQIDVLFDLNGHHPSNRLSVFAHRAAPLQISWLAYPATTGLEQIDYRLTDRIVDPVGINEHNYSEELARLSHSFVCFDEPDSTPAIEKSESNEIVRFGSFNSLAKISPRTLDAWAICLHRVSNSTLCLKRKQLKSERARTYYRSQFEQRGINQDRLILLADDPSPNAHLAQYNNIDIALDTSPMNGLATTFEALWMGTPVISLSAKTSASRIGARLLDAVQLSDLCVNRVSEFGESANRLAQDPALRVQLNRNLRKQLQTSDLMNTRQFGADFTYLVKRCWQKKINRLEVSEAS